MICENSLFNFLLDGARMSPKLGEYSLRMNPDSSWANISIALEFALLGMAEASEGTQSSSVVLPKRADDNSVERTQPQQAAKFGVESC